MTKTELVTEIERLTREREQDGRHFGAMTEWLMIEHYATDTLDVLGLRIHVRGMQRASGGVARIEIIGADYLDLPRYLDDVIAEWRYDSTQEIRDAARLLSQRRDERNKV